MKYWFAVAAAFAMPSCGDDDDAMTLADASLFDVGFTPIPDAAPLDAGGLCGNEFVFTGDYVDWDSVTADFDGVEFAEFVVVGNDTNTAMTAPNGRVILCVSPDGDFDAIATQTDYVPLRFGVSLAAAMVEPFQARGIRPARIDTLYADDFGVARDPAETTVAINAPPDAGVAIGAPHDATAVHGADPRFRLFANVEGGDTTVAITPPTGQTCSHRATIPLEPGGIGYTHVVCQ